MDFKVELLQTGFVTHDVKRFVVARPPGLDYRPGQGVELAVDTPAWREEGRPFTPTNLLDDRVLEFIIKRYPAHEGVTEQLHRLRPGDKLLMSQAFGTIRHRGPGWFIAGGAGITPFLAILRQLQADDRLDSHGLMFSNKTPADVICERELRHAFGDRALLTCTDERAPGFLDGRIDKAFLQRHVGDFAQQFYVCGPPPFVSAINQALEELGAAPDALIFEK